MVPEKYQVAYEKLQHAVKLLNEKDIDLWLVLTREGSDPADPLLMQNHSVHQAAVFIKKDGKHVILTSQNDRGNFEETGLFSEVRAYGASIGKELLEEFNRIDPNKMALNISESDHLCDGLTLGQYMQLEKLIGREKLEKIEVSSEEMMKELRSIKSKTELERIQKAVDLTIDIYEEVFSDVRCGMTEKEIGQLFIEGMKKRGVSNGIGSAYDPPIVCDVKAGLAHRKPGNTKVEPGDIVIMDFSVKYKDYVSDIARTMYFLKPGEKEAPAEIQHAFDIAVKAISTTIEYIGSGRKGFEVDAVGRKVIVDGGYPTIRHSAGHQIGRECHDGGTVLGPRRDVPRPEVEGTVRLGEVYAIEPTVIQDNGLPCMLVEENVVITEQGAKLLSKRQLELVKIPCE